MFRIGFEQRIIHKLHIVQHFFFTTFACAFAKATIIHQYYIIIIAVKIAGVFGPAFYTSAISMEIQDKASGLFPEKMKSIYPDAGCYIKKILSERNVIFELEILL